MRVIHSGSCNVLAGGPALSTSLTVKGLRQHGIDARVIMEPLTAGQLFDESLNPHFTEPTKFGGLAYVPNITQTLDKAGVADMYHIQGMWMLHGYQVARYALKHKKPYIVTLRGMLYPEALKHNAIIKKLSLLTYQGHTLRHASAIQCTCTEEMEHYRRLGFKNPVAILPNPIDIIGIVDRPIPQRPIFRVGYLGRVHPRKRVERIIYAMSNLRESLPTDSELVIIGGGDEAYEDFLKKEVSDLGLTNVRFTGFITGKEKDYTISSLSVLVVPSDFENFGNIVTEALVRGVPVIASTGTPWQILPEKHCGWWISNDQVSIDKTILEAYTLGENAISEMGRHGQALMKQCYSVETLGQKMKVLYEWILGIAEKPDFVYVES